MDQSIIESFKIVKRIYYGICDNNDVRVIRSKKKLNLHLHIGYKYIGYKYIGKVIYYSWANVKEIVNYKCTW